MGWSRRIWLAVGLLLLLGVPAPAETLRMAWFVVHPHVFASPDGKSPIGPSVELFSQIAKRMGCKVEWVGPLPLSRLGSEQKSAIGSLRLDGTFLHIKTPAIERYLLYPRAPYFIGHPSLAVLATNPLTRIRGIEDIRGYRIGFVKTASLSYPPIILANRNVLILDNLSGENWTSRNLQKLLANRLDAVYERNQYTLAFQAAVDGIADQVKILDLPGEAIPHYFVFHRNSKRASGLLDRYEEAVAGMKFDYDAIVRSAIAAYLEAR